MFKDLGRSLAGPPAWLALVAVAIIGVYLVVLLERARRRPGRVPSQQTAALRAVNDMPSGWIAGRGQRMFIVTAALAGAAIWLIAWVIAPDARAFAVSREWHAQPLYLFAHLVTVRVFASILSTNYIAGAGALDMKPHAAIRRVRRLNGWLSLLPALLVALPFIAVDLRYFLSPRYVKLSGNVVPAAADWLMFGVWSVEWLLNALVWSMLVGFLILNIRTLRRYQFAAPIHIVLMQKQYRPFLRMSAQGASVVLAFSIVTALYILYASGELTDYIGLIITVGLLGICFLPPWLLLRAKINAVVQRDLAVLQQAVGRETVEQLVAAVATGDVSNRHGAEAVVMMRMLHLDRMHDDVGRREAMEVMFRLLAPAATIGWQLWQNGGMIAGKIGDWMRGLAS